MQLLKLAIALPILFGTACSTSRIDHAAIDPAILADCPREVESPGELPLRATAVLPDGSLAVPIASANERELMLTRGILAFRGAWTKCRSVVIYVEDREEGLSD